MTYIKTAHNTEIPVIPEPDAHGQAALLLAESILHVLVENAAISRAEAIATVRTACEVKVEVAELSGESKGRMQESLDLLSRIAESLETDEDMVSPESPR